MYYLLIAVYVLVCLVLSLVILLQQGRGGDIANAFGGSSSQAAFGARSGATLLTKATSIAAVLFMLFALTLSILGQRTGSGSLLSGAPAPVPAAAPKPAPASPAPPAPVTAPSPGAPATQQPVPPAK